MKIKKTVLATILLASIALPLQGCLNFKKNDTPANNNTGNNDTEDTEPVFTLASDSLVLNLDDEYVLDYTVKNIDSSIKWSSSNANVVGVSGNKLIAKNEGEAVITAKAGTIERTCNISVSAANSGQYFIDSAKAINIEFSNKAGVLPELNYFVIRDNKKYKILNETPIYNTKDESIAKVVDGMIVPVSIGQTTLKVDYPNASTEYIVNVCDKIITKETQFLNMINSRDAGSFFALENDLDFTGKTYDAYGTGNDLLNYGEAFKGTFEGNGFTIKGIKIVGQSKHNSIFGMLNNAHIKDVNFEDLILQNNGVESMAIFANAMTGDDCEIKNVKVSCNFTGLTSGNINLLTSKYLEKSFTNVISATSSEQVSFGPSKFTNVLIDAKFNGKTMSEANVNVCQGDSYNFKPKCENVLIYAPGGTSEELPNGVRVYSNKLDIIWDIHNNKYLPDTNWDYSEQFQLPSLLNASSTSGFVYNQGDKIDIDSNYEPIIVNKLGVQQYVYPYGENVEGFVYGDHPTGKSTKAVFVDQRWAPYTTNLTVPAADLDLNNYTKVCFFVRTNTFNKSFITIKDLNTNKDYSTLLYDCEVSDKWIKVELLKVSTDHWTVYIGKDKINFTYTATYFKDIPIRFNDTRYYYTEMLGVKDPNVVPKEWISTGAFIKKTNGDSLPTTTTIVCRDVNSTASTIVEGAGPTDLAKFISQNTNDSKEFKFYVRGDKADGNYFVLSLNGSDSIPDLNGTPQQGLISFRATNTNWTCFMFVINEGKLDIYRNNQLMSSHLNAQFNNFGVQLSGGKFYVSEMFCYK
mgnify:CR=1 FL=1